MLRKILVVDDAPLIHEMCRIFLTRHRGACVIGERSGAAALDRLTKEGGVDLILLDVHMPQMNGLELLRRLKQEPSCRDIPVLIISTSASEASIERGLAAGAEGYLPKPFQADDLNRAIDTVMRRRVAARPERKAAAPPLKGPWAVRQPASGHTRIVCSEPCRVSMDRDDLQGVVWNLSVRGVYLILTAPFPEVGQRLDLTFLLPGETQPMTCRGRVAWRNPPSVFQGLGSIATGLPPGCGVEFLGLTTADQKRIGAVVAVA